MDIWRSKSLFTYVPEGAPELFFVYHPLSANFQEALHRKYDEFTSTYALMKAVCSERLCVFAINDGETFQVFPWPYEHKAQEGLFDNIPKNIIIEVGASLLGWRKSRTEDVEDFVMRVVKSLEKSNLLE